MIRKKMKDNSILSKASGMEEVKKYFTAVLELSKSNEEFPVNLDEVWMLVYSEKGKAVRALTTNEQFIEGIDYKVFAQNGENPQGGRPTNEYYLSISCLEFFIARKVRAVFEVYRQVFHHLNYPQAKDLWDSDFIGECLRTSLTPPPSV